MSEILPWSSKNLAFENKVQILSFFDSSENYCFVPLPSEFVFTYAYEQGCYSFNVDSFNKQHMRHDSVKLFLHMQERQDSFFQPFESGVQKSAAEPVVWQAWGNLKREKIVFLLLTFWWAFS